MTYTDMRDEARARYAGLNLPTPSVWRPSGRREYWAITTDELIELNELCGKHLSICETTTIEMRMHDMPQVFFSDGFVEAAFLRVDGSYFEDREAISFNGDGFIGFCGWASSKNERPFLDAFEEWCAWLARTHVRRGDRK